MLDEKYDVDEFDEDLSEEEWTELPLKDNPREEGIRDYMEMIEAEEKGLYSGPKVSADFLEEIPF